MDTLPITPEWLASIGFLQDGDKSDNEEYGKKVWSVSHVGNDEDDNSIQVLVSAKDQSIWLEVYDRDGDSLALIELPGGTCGHVLRLCESLGMQLMQGSST